MRIFVSRRVTAAFVVVGAAVALGAIGVGASTPPTDSVTVPDKAGQTVTVSGPARSRRERRTPRATATTSAPARRTTTR